MEQVVLDFLKQKMVDNNETFKILEASVGISDSTLSKWYSGKGEMSTYGLTLIANHYGYSSLCEFFASIPLATVPQEKQQDMDIVLRIIDECNADKSFHSQHCEMLLDHQRELRALEREKHEELRAQIEAHHKKVVAYLSKQVSRFRLTSIVFCVLFVCGAIYNTFISVADVPQLGAAGSVWNKGDASLGFLRMITVPLLILLLGVVIWLLVSNHKMRHPAQRDESQS